MKLTLGDKALPLDMGCAESNFLQIEEATRKTDYEYCGKRIGWQKALELLGRRNYLSGISRSAFHFSAVRFTPQNVPVYFDSGRLFK